MYRQSSGSSGEILIFTRNSSKLLVAFLALVVIVAGIAAYSIWRTAKSVSSHPAERADGDTGVPSNILRATGQNRAQWRSQLQPPAVNVAQATPDVKAGASAVRSDTMAEIQRRTREDGALREVAVDGKPVSPQLVEETIFNNRNFATHANYEFPLLENRPGHDKTQTRPRSMFGPLTAPLAAGGYAMDIGGKIVK